MALRRYDLLKRRSSFFRARPSFVGRVVGWIAGGGAGGGIRFKRRLHVRCFVDCSYLRRGLK